MLRPAIPLLKAAQDSPMLGKLADLTRLSSERLRLVLPLIPAGLQSTVQGGPIDGDTWCLLVRGNAAAAKLRQLTPALLASLRSKGHEVNSIRLKIQTGQST